MVTLRRRFARSLYNRTVDPFVVASRIKVIKGLAGGIPVAQSDAVLLTTVVTGLYAVLIVGVSVWQWFAIKNWRDALFMGVLGYFFGPFVEQYVLWPLLQVESLLAPETVRILGHGMATLFALVLLMPLARLLMVTAEGRESKVHQFAFYGGALACLAVLLVLSTGRFY